MMGLVIADKINHLQSMAIEMLGTGWKEKSIIILAGSGGNGGGGVCAAPRLANKGANVKLCLINPGKLSEVPDFQLKIFNAAAADIGIPQETYRRMNLLFEKPFLTIGMLSRYFIKAI